MRKFIIEIIILIGLLLIAVVIMDTGKKSPGAFRFIKIKKDKDIVIMGNSHSAAIRFNLLRLNGGAFNRAGNTIYYDLQNYNYLKKHLSDSAIIVLPVSFFSFGLEENRIDRGEDNPFVNEFYEYLPASAIKDYSIKKELNLKIGRIQKRIQLAELLSDNKPSKRRKKKKKSAPSLKQIIKRLDKSAKSAISHHKNIFGFGSAERNTTYLQSLISDAQNNGYRPVLVTTPYYKSYLEGFDLDWLATNFYSYINQLQNATNIQYLDYSRDARFSENPEFYRNSDHLNTVGEREFSKVLFEDFVKLGLLQKADIRPPKKK